MARLKTLKPLVGKLPPRIANQAGEEIQRSRFRDETQAWRRWYKTSRWQKLRWSVLVRDMFTCQMCQRIEADTSLLVGDHKRPHRGDEALFWDESNIQCVCKQCHDSDKQRQERGCLVEACLEARSADLPKHRDYATRREGVIAETECANSAGSNL